MFRGLLNRSFIVRFCMVPCLTYSLCTADYSISCSCREKTPQSIGHCDVSEVHAQVETGCCFESTGPERERQNNATGPSENCSCCTNGCYCVAPDGTKIALLQKTWISHRRPRIEYGLPAATYTSLAESERQMHIQFPSMNPLSTPGRNTNAVLCVFLC